MSSESELLSALLALEPITEEPVEYRIYYNESGEITQCSMRDHATEGQYLVVTADEYDNYYHYTVINGKLKKIDRTHNFRVKLTKSRSGYPVAKNHAGVLIEPNDVYQNIEYYDDRNN